MWNMAGKKIAHFCADICLQANKDRRTLMSSPFLTLY